MVNLPAAFFVLFDRQFFPLVSQLKLFRYVVEEGMEGSFGAGPRLPTGRFGKSTQQ